MPNFKICNMYVALYFAVEQDNFLKTAISGTNLAILIGSLTAK
jgi:hypothetical protein